MFSFYHGANVSEVILCITNFKTLDIYRQKKPLKKAQNMMKAAPTLKSDLLQNHGKKLAHLKILFLFFSENCL